MLLIQETHWRPHPLLFFFIFPPFWLLRKTKMMKLEQVSEDQIVSHETHRNAGNEHPRNSFPPVVVIVETTMGGGGNTKEDERNEKLVRNLLKLPQNRTCINCNNLGPQYVCTDFWTFVCVTCSGIHREFNHRVKSVSMAKFSKQEVETLQNDGGNQRAREIFLKHWDMNRMKMPGNSNVSKLREFVKDVYVDKIFASRGYLDACSRNLQGHENTDDHKVACSCHSLSQSIRRDAKNYDKLNHFHAREPSFDEGTYDAFDQGNSDSKAHSLQRTRSLITFGSNSFFKSKKLGRTTETGRELEPQPRRLIRAATSILSYRSKQSATENAKTKELLDSPTKSKEPENLPTVQLPRDLSLRADVACEMSHQPSSPMPSDAGPSADSFTENQGWATFQSDHEGHASGMDVVSLPASQNGFKLDPLQGLAVYENSSPISVMCQVDLNENGRWTEQSGIETWHIFDDVSSDIPETVDHPVHLNRLPKMLAPKLLNGEACNPTNGLELGICSDRKSMNPFDDFCNAEQETINSFPAFDSLPGPPFSDHRFMSCIPLAPEAGSEETPRRHGSSLHLLSSEANVAPLSGNPFA